MQSRKTSALNDITIPLKTRQAMALNDRTIPLNTRQELFENWKTYLVPFGLALRCTFALHLESFDAAIMMLVVIIDMLHCCTLYFNNGLVGFITYTKLYYIINLYLYQYIAGPHRLTSLISLVYLVVFAMTKTSEQSEDGYSWFLIINTVVASALFGEFKIPELLQIFCMLSFIYIGFSTFILLIGKCHRSKLSNEILLVEHETKTQILATTSHELRNPLQALTFLVTFLTNHEQKKPGSLLTNEKCMETLNDISEVINLLNGIIDNVLDFSKLGEQKMSINKSKMCPMELVERIGCMFAPKISDKGINLYVDVDPELPRFVLGDSTKILQILSNLMNNAIKFTSKGYITLKLALKEVRGNQCVLEYSCQDTGVGMSVSDQQRLFLPFEQIDSGEQPVDQRGWGLGLSICKEIIRLMDGSITCESTLGIGSTFTVLIPHDLVSTGTYRDMLKTIPRQSYCLVDPDPIESKLLKKYLSCMNSEVIKDGWEKTNDLHADILIMNESAIPYFPDHEKNIWKHKFYIGEMLDKDHRVIMQPVCLLRMYRALSKTIGAVSKHPHQEAHGIHSGSLLDKTILIVEDNKIIHKMERRFLEQLGVGNILSAWNGEDAISIVNEKEIDIILMDIQMPVMNGMDATRKIRSLDHPVKSKIPIVVITGNTCFEFDDFKKIGANAVLAKPVTMENISKTIGDIITENQ